jgi:hypothetical protein
MFLHPKKEMEIFIFYFILVKGSLKNAQQIPLFGPTFNLGIFFTFQGPKAGTISWYIPKSNDFFRSNQGLQDG